mmetsp:Transcript_105878/g.199395  ORF Transcript_105878/g.199395 Transcript_105878/m.199395 type:complete len:393 (-) Transcript_105878:135-1313(-)
MISLCQHILVTICMLLRGGISNLDDPIAFHQCCVPDLSTCSGQSVAIQCGEGKYLDPEKVGNYLGSDPVASCCTEVATCSSLSYRCPDGFRRKANASNTRCESDADSCVHVCCENDSDTCGGNYELFGRDSAGCGTYGYRDPAKAGKAHRSNAMRNCCTRRATCGTADYTCPGGLRRKAGVDTKMCRSNEESCMYTCCQDMCSSQPDFVCGSRQMRDPAKDNNLARPYSPASCCTDISTCRLPDYRCPAGYVNKMNNIADVLSVTATKSMTEMTIMTKTTMSSATTTTTATATATTATTAAVSTSTSNSTTTTTTTTSMIAIVSSSPPLTPLGGFFTLPVLLGIAGAALLCVSCTVLCLFFMCGTHKKKECGHLDHITVVGVCISESTIAKI